jgi:hypothetical protein
MADRSDFKKALVVHAFINSAMEDVLKFKTACCFKLSDQNLEIQVENIGQVPVTVPSYFDLEGEQGIKQRIDTLFPSGQHLILPGERKAFYCMMDEKMWNNSRKIIFYDLDGCAYEEEIKF